MLELGQLLITPGAADAFMDASEPPSDYLSRHMAGDWGDVDAEDSETNNEALLNGDRILSAYHLKNGTKIWIITEWDRSVTTILLPEEY